MGDNSGHKPIGNRLNLIDPNDFENQYASGMFGDTKYNMSVPLEDLSITVELKTTTKNRTILTTEGNLNTSVTTGSNGKGKNGVISVNFIEGTNDSTTGGVNSLTTKYTDLNTELSDIKETLGITNIEIDFNSSYAPLVSIDFVDVKGGSLFQNNGKSDYNVFFRLPYPIFELTIKGFYGKPVTYCLHMTKCNTKFNSQTGNFEIAANFVGYTYAMLSDMLIGYLKAAGITTRGKELLKEAGVSSIPDFLKQITNIDKMVKDRLLTSDNVDVKNLSIINDLKEILESFKDLIKSTVLFKLVDYQKYDVPDAYIDQVNLHETIALVINPDTDPITFADTKNYQVIIPEFLKQANDKVGSFNGKIDKLADIELRSLVVKQLITTYSDITTSSSDLRTKISTQYGTDNTDDINNILQRLKIASGNVSGRGGFIKFYDFFDLMRIIEERLTKLNEIQIELTKEVALKLQELITNQLGFDTSIRSIFNIFTTHVEVFLQQLFEVSSQYGKPARLAQLNKFKNKKSLDIKDNSPIIYPWPEYNENNIEKYLGGKSAGLSNPLDVPEIKFVEELYQAMIKVQEVENDLNATVSTDVVAWFGFNPLDSYYWNSGETNPYERLGSNPDHNDIARLVTLRAIGYMQFSNRLLSEEEITKFAIGEANLVTSLFKVSSNNLVKILKENFKSANDFANVTGSVDSSKKRVLVESGANWKYNYIYEGTGRKVLPITSNFKDSLYNLPKNNETLDQVKFKLSNLDTYIAPDFRPLTDGANYIDFVIKNDYEKSILLPETPTESVFKFTELKSQITTSAQLTQAGFIANSGTYGVQDFKLINYGGTENLPFYSIFYNNGNTLQVTNMIDGSTNVKLSPALCRIRSISDPTTLETKFDLPKSNSGVMNLPTTTRSENSNIKINKIYKSRKDVGNNIVLLGSLITNGNVDNSDVSYPFFNFGIQDKNAKTLEPETQMSLFGSRFYNAQTISGKTFLFLHTFPWRGLVSESGSNVGLFRQTELLNVFQHRTGFVQVPKLLPAFIGGLLWRYSEGLNGQDPIAFKNGSDFLVPSFGTATIISFGDKLPSTSQYMRVTNRDVSAAPMSFNSTSSAKYADLEPVLLTLPASVRAQFIKEFLSFVTEFDTIRKDFEIVPINQGNLQGDAAWVSAWGKIDALTSRNGDTVTANLSNITSNLKLANQTSFLEAYNVFSYIPSTDDLPIKQYDNNYFIEFKDTAKPNLTLKKLFLEYKYISNNSWVMWNQVYKAQDPNTIEKDVLVSKVSFASYINAFNSKITDAVSATEKRNFNSNESEEIKLEIYRTLKKIYDKWIAFSDNPDSVVFQCCKGPQDRLAGDAKMNKHRNRSNQIPKLIDSFRFVSRSFRDIGDIFQINPIMVSKLLMESSNISFYDLSSRILTDNNFDFVALPSFIDYNNLDELKSIFKPYPYYEAATVAKSGPSFVCVYVGQTSSKLDFGPDADHPNDGFDLTRDCINCPEDIKSGRKEDWEDVGAAFVVKYGQQNQNIFKDISLDQSEFSETAESLQITDNIANKLSDVNKSYMGQNLYNVYSVRSYKAEVEMLGNAMIQPMMYFQLDNIPMFHGAYLITRVKHSLKPNTMSTTFSGVRIKGNETPLLDAASLYSGLLSTYELPKAVEGSRLTTVVGSFPPIVVTLINNQVNNGYVPKGNITFSKVPAIKKVYNAKINDAAAIREHRDSLLTQASNALVVMLNDFVSYAEANNLPKSNEFKDGNGNPAYIGISSLFRTYEFQKNLYDKSSRNGTVAPPGTSNHGWGLAVDFLFVKSNGTHFDISSSDANIQAGFDISQNISLKWFIDNGYKYGFFMPIKLRDGTGIEEFWHFEYHGKAAICLWQKYPSVRGYILRIPENQQSYNPIVINPLEPNNTEAVYGTDCGFTSIKQGDGPDLLSTKTSLKDLQKNQLYVKNFLKEKGLSKEIVAGMMGNMETECHFNVSLPAGQDTRGFSFGLIQWNSQSYPDAVQKVGTTIEGQIEHVVNGYTNGYAKFLREARATSNLDAATAAYLFAKNVEICSGCNEGLTVYNTGKRILYRGQWRTVRPIERSNYASDFFRRFNTPSDTLFW